MIAAIDIGNTNIVMGVWNGQQWIHQHRIETNPGSPAKFYHQQIQLFFEDVAQPLSSLSSVVIGSVVPVLTTVFEDFFERRCSISALIVNASLKTGLRFNMDHPEKVGADIIADAVGARAITKGTCIVVDLGTATTVMAMDKKATLLGGAICAGLNVSVASLVEKTAQLPDIPLQVPDSPLGNDTVSAMQAGLVMGHLCMIEGLIDRMKQKIGAAKVIATGGLVSVLAPHTSHFDYVKPLLTLDGLRLILKRQ